MQISDLIVGTLLAIAISIASIDLITTMYDVDDAHSYQVNLSNDNYTSGLTDMKNNLTASKLDTESNTNSIYNNIIGENNSKTNGGTQTQSDVWASSLLSLTGIGKYLTQTFSLFRMFALAFGLSSTSVALWFITTSLILLVALTIIGIVFFRPL